MRVRWRRPVFWMLVLMLTTVCFVLFHGFSRNDAEDYVMEMFQLKTSEHRHPTVLDTFRERREQVRKACLRGPGIPRRPTQRHKTMWMQSIAFCSVAKTGTTFWKRILYYVDSDLKGPLLSHDFGDVHGKTKYMQGNKRFSKTRSYKNIVFVREPYLRLLSAYGCKMFVPRYSNWQRYAKPVMTFSRKAATQEEKACSHNVTFAEFVRYFIHVELSEPNASNIRDEHFVPVSQQCNFCGTSFDFIGRQETFAEDTMGILMQFNLSAMLKLSDFDESSKQYELQALIKYTFEHEIDPISQKYQCMSKEEILRRIWKYLQMHGMINAEQLFPLKKADISTLTEGDFLNHALLAYNQSLRVPETKLNEKNSFVEAYSSVPLQDRLLLKYIFQDDFSLFGYKADHPLVFPAGDQFILSRYRYFDIFDSFLNSK